MANKESRMRLVCGVAVVIMGTALFAAVRSFAGDVEPGASPGAAMKSLREVHDKVEEIDAKMTGLAPVARTGQTRVYYYLDDGWMQAGKVWPDPRFTDNGDGTFTDNLTGLVWLKNCECTDAAGGVDMTGDKDWFILLQWTAALADPACGLSDGSVAGDWRVPSIVELLSLVDYGRHSPALPEGHPFVNFDFGDYNWVVRSGTLFAEPGSVRCVDFRIGAIIRYSYDTEFAYDNTSEEETANMVVRDAKEGEQGGAP